MKKMSTRLHLPSGSLPKTPESGSTYYQVNNAMEKLFAGQSDEASSALKSRRDSKDPVEDPPRSILKKRRASNAAYSPVPKLVLVEPQLNQTQAIHIDDQEALRPVKKPSIQISELNSKTPLLATPPDDKKTSRPESKESLQH